MPTPASNRATEPTGIVFDIQRFSIHDGPGIRTTVFLKGCPLRCAWCSNPESQELSPTLLVRESSCRRSGACAKVCPEGAIALVDGEGRKIDWARCNHCLECVEACIYGSLNACGREMRVEAVVAEVVRDRPFYETSNGGVTISGGEALSQPEFLLALLGALKDEALHTVLDTSGFAPRETFEAVLPLVDLLLYDVKHLDEEEHRRTTGVCNELILENLRRASKSTPIWLRVPLISGFNDSEEHIREVTALAKEVGAERISLLPYHEGGASKCRQIGRPYAFEEGRAPDAERVSVLRELIERVGVVASIEH
jgi:pyruvate formate lyase activating enzyme